jgi:hypothetical protein
MTGNVAFAPKQTPDPPPIGSRKVPVSTDNGMEDRTRPPGGAPSAIYFPDGLGRVCDVVPREEFVVCVNGEDCALSLVEAVFLSPRIFSALKSDTTIRCLDITDEHIESKYIDDLLTLLRGGSVTVTKSSRLPLLRLSRQLGNSYLIQLFFGLRDEGRVIGPLGETSLGFDLTIPSREDVFQVDVETLDHLLRSDELRIASEDWLLELIIDLGSDYRVLLNAVKYEFLSADGG